MTDPRNFFLIADDDMDDQFLIQDVIRSVCPEEIETRFVNNGMELMDFLGQLNGQTAWPGVVILDLNMPRKDGRQALQEIKADPTFSNIPVVILTTSQAAEDIANCRKLGAAGFYQKPSSISELREIILKLYQEYFP